MIVKLLLDRKRMGEELSSGEIHELIAAYTRGDVPDYQMAAFAMAVCCRGMTAAETLALTEAMRDSGTCLTWPADEFPPTADKHSTGGVGDKLSLVIQPLAAACGLAVPSLTGRGLGLTGGTADKMESIPGYVAALSLADYRRVVATCGCSLTVQTEEIAPADRKLYGLRDVTGTVPSIPLIVASILSKKLAEGADTLVFDVKCGAGAFMKTLPEARALAQALVAGAQGAGRRARALVTAMDEPLGYAVGNANEVAEALDVLEGRGPQDVRDLSIELAAHMVALSRWGQTPEERVQTPETRGQTLETRGQTPEERGQTPETRGQTPKEWGQTPGKWGQTLEVARELCAENLKNGVALARFQQMVELQGGDLAAFARKRSEPTMSCEVVAPQSGFVAHIDANRIAQAAFELGAGRARASDVVDLLAGVDLRVTHGDRVTSGMPVARVSTTTRGEKLAVATDLVRAALTITPQPPPPHTLVLETL